MSVDPLSHALPRAERTALRRAIKLLQIKKKRFIISVLFGSCAVGSGVGLGSVSAWLIARAAQLPPVLDLQIAATAVRVFGIGKALFRYLQRIASHWVALRGMAAVRSAVYNRLADSSTDVVSSLNRGDILARTGADVDELGHTVVKSFLPACVALIVSLISVGIVAGFSPAIAASLAACLLFSGIVAPYCAMVSARQAEIAEVAHRATLHSQALTLMEHAGELRVSGAISAMHKAQEATEVAIQKSRNRSARPAALASAIDTIAMCIAVIAALWIGIHEIHAGTLSAIGLIVCTLTPLSAFEATQGLPAAAIQLVRSARSAVRVMEILDAARPAAARLDKSFAEASHPRASTPTQKAELTETPAPTKTPAATARAACAEPGALSSAEQHISTMHAEEHILEARDLCFGWPSRPHVGGPISLTLRLGKSIAIVGHSGIGKTTLLNTLAGMIKPTSGSMNLSGMDPYMASRTSVSRELVLTEEDAHVFATTVLENIRVARADVEPDEARELLIQAGLEEWLNQLPKGVHTMVGTDAGAISGGERRRLLLARALASRAPFLLLDEPGEHLDPATADRLIADLLGTAHSGRGIILVTHRLSPLHSADEVIMLGRSATAQSNEPATVIRRGSHEQLIATVPEYAWSAQQENGERG